MRHTRGSSPPDGRKILQDAALSTQICAASTRSVPRAPRIRAAREALAQPPSFHLRQRITLRAPPRKALRPHWRNQEVACPPQPGHVPGGSGRSPGVVVGVGCGLLRAAGRVVRLGRWGVYRCWSLVARLGHWVGSQVARVVGMASSRYQVQKARRAGTSVCSSGCQFRAPAAALAQL